ncbi:MAG TPA: 16S rRNA (uracil(1498)-N(3))-methyltransferase [Steroidobacteraceae bacterium]|nr:16S rRNA (uracil(1498)-N(3))-methyltransferase [Steroidobacteraceae bacterium]
MSRLYTEVPVAGRAAVTLSGAAAGHVSRVLRLRAGDALVLFDGTGGEYPATIEGFGRDAVHLALGPQRALERESPLAITLAQGISRGERMDFVVQKATELGVARIIPVLAERTVVRLDEAAAASRMRHWRAVAVAACEQCGRNRLPEVCDPVALAALPARLPAQGPRLLLAPGGSLKVRELAPAAAVTVLIGPEGGLSEAEESWALRAGFQALVLGPRILRTETAALAVLAVLQERLGDL